MISNSLPAPTLTRPAALALCTYNIPQSGGSGALIGKSQSWYTYFSTSVCQNQLSFTRHPIKSIPKCDSYMLWSGVHFSSKENNQEIKLHLFPHHISFILYALQYDDNVKPVFLSLSCRDPSCISDSHLHQLRGAFRWATQCMFCWFYNIKKLYIF